MNSYNPRNVQIYDMNQNYEYRDVIAIDEARFPAAKYSNSGMYYAIRADMNGKTGIMICTPKEWASAVARAKGVNGGKSKGKIGIIVFAALALVLSGTLVFGAIKLFGSKDGKDVPTKEPEAVETKKTVQVPESGTVSGVYSLDGGRMSEILFEVPEDAFYKYYIAEITSKEDSQKSFTVFMHRGNKKLHYLTFGEYDVTYYGGNDWYGYEDKFRNNIMMNSTLSPNMWYNYNISMGGTENAVNAEETEIKTPLYGHTEEAMPEHGTVLYNAEASEENAPFVLEVDESAGVYYYITLEGQNGNIVQSVFMRSGTSIQVNVPVGTYKLRVACGDKWYGYENLFGPYGAYSEDENDISFKYENQTRCGTKRSFSLVRE